MNRPSRSGLLRLTRWPEHIPFTVPATLLGIDMAAGSGLTLDWRIPVVMTANILAVAFAFMVNDLEDAPDDAREDTRAARNVITCGEITPRAGRLASALVAALALALFAALSRETFTVGISTLTLGVLYSWRGVRLKALPVLDVISHALMLSSLLFLAGYLVYDDTPGRAWLVTLVVGMVSAYGQLYNQLRDYQMDRAAGLRNTASFLGSRGTQIIMYACLIGAALCFFVTVLLGLWPLWLAVVPVVVAPLGWWFRSDRDMRGTAALDLSGRWQGRAMMIANVTLLVWLVAKLIS
jgi:4-hydroxybenzoate polyprenyltransferase